MTAALIEAAYAGLLAIACAAVVVAALLYAFGAALMNQTRFSRRMGEHYPYGAEYGCAITRHASRHRAADIALYIVGAIGFVAAIVFNNFGA